MNSETKKNSDLGFYIFLIVAGILLIPLAIGAKNFDQIIKLGKIMLIVVIVLAAVAIGVVSYIRIMKQAKKREKKSKARKEQQEEEPPQEETNEIKTVVEREEEANFEIMIVPKKPTEISE